MGLRVGRDVSEGILTYHMGLQIFGNVHGANSDVRESLGASEVSKAYGKRFSKHGPREPAPVHAPATYCSIPLGATIFAPRSYVLHRFVESDLPSDEVVGAFNMTWPDREAALCQPAERHPTCRCRCPGALSQQIHRAAARPCPASQACDAGGGVATIHRHQAVPLWMSEHRRNAC